MASPPTAAPSTTWIQGWGGIGVQADQRLGEDLVRLSAQATLSRGLGRSYGDSSLPAPGGGPVACTVLADRILAFDTETGLLRAEAGLSLRTLVRLLLPRGWFVPVTPGTSFVTLGGMVASDVHGKNHHVAGCIGEHVTRLWLRLADGRIVECSPQAQPDLFWATVGGMGLTGHILEVEFRMVRVPSPWIWQQSERVPDIDAFMDRLKEGAARWPMTVGWIDCATRGRSMGRGHFFAGRWAEPGEAPSRAPRPRRRSTVPPVVPSGLIVPATVRLVNTGIYWSHLRSTWEGIVHPEDFFYPLDKLLHWNRLYGRRGFTQYQCVLPEQSGRGVARRFLDLLTRTGGASPLCVIKDCGEEGHGLLSFPRRGISIALDIAINAGTQRLVDTLNDFVLAEGGRIYLTKDAYTRPEHFAAMEKRLPRFQELRRRFDPELRFRSAQSVRLFGDPP